MDKTNKTNKMNKEHILACLSSSPSNMKIVNTALQMARAFGGKFTALYVKTPDSENMSRENRERLEKNIRYAEDSGAEIVTVYGDDVVYQIIEFARISGVTKIVLGRSNSGKGFLRKTTLTDKIIKESQGIDIHIIPDTEAVTGHRIYKPFPAVRPPTAVQWCLMLLFLVFSTVLGFIFHALEFTEANTITVYMLGVLITALVTKNYITNGVFSIVSVLLFNFFFTEPRLSFRAYDSGYPATLAIMLISSLIIGTLANKLATSARLSANAAYRTNIMLGTNRLLQKSENEDDAVLIMANQLLKLLSRNIIIYPIKNGMMAEPKILKTGEKECVNLLSDSEKNVARWVYENRKRAGAGTDNHSDAEGLYLCVKNGEEVFAVVGIDMGGRLIEPFESSIIISILGECALTVENLKNAKEKEEIALFAKNEQLRANLLRAISHDLRTPLTSILGNTENLLTNFSAIDKETRITLLSDIYDDAEWLISLVENLLSVSRINEGRMEIKLSSQLVDEVITEALKHTSRKSTEHNIITDFGNDLLLAKMDARLITQVIINLVDNAIKYTRSGSNITVSAKAEERRIVVSVADDGDGIPDEAKYEVFKMFYTGENKIADHRRSLGLGLSLCESIISSHGGTISLSDNKPHGCIFTFTLERSEVCLNE